MFSETPKPKTPMYFLKNQLAVFKAFPFVTFKMLNRKGGGYTFVGTQMFEQKPITFDCIYLFNLRNSKSSFSFSFNFFEGEQTVRATFRPNQNAGVEYSKEYSVKEMKDMMNSFTAKYKDVSFVNEQAKFTKAFTEHFNITLSCDIPPDEVKKLCGKFGALFIDVNTQINRADILMKKADKTKGKSDFDKAAFIELCKQRDEAHKAKNLLFTFGLLEAPHIVRKQVRKTFAA
jgi:hypothetical protein